MTPKERAAMQQALEALEVFTDTNTWPKGIKAVNALREALNKQATEPAGRCKWCLAYNGHLDFCPALTKQAEPDIEEMTLTQIAARHEQAEQEPVATVKTLSMEYGVAPFHYIECNHLPEGTKLYAAPVRTKDLTDDEIEWLVVDTLETWNSKDTMKDFARAVIAKYKEKNK